MDSNMELREKLNLFLKKKWQKQAATFGYMPLISEEDLWDACINHIDEEAKKRNVGSLKGIRGYISGINGKGVIDLSGSGEIKNILPQKEDGSWEGYRTRVEGQSQADDGWFVVLNETHQYSSKIAERMLGFFEPLIEQIGIPLENLTVGIFIGKCNSTPFGIHADKDLENFYCPIIGRKRMWLWEPQNWSGVDFDLPPEFRSISEDDKVSATVLDIRKGELAYWPADFWHVGETPEFTVAASVAIIAPKKSQSRFTIRNLLLKELVNETSSLIESEELQSPFIPYPVDTNMIAVPAQLTKEADRILACSENMKEIAKEWLMAICSNMGSQNSGLADTSFSVPAKSIITPTGDWPLYWYVNREEDLLVFGRGVRWVCWNHSIMLDILKQISNGMTINTSDMINALPESSDDSLDQESILLFLGSLNRAGIVKMDIEGRM